MSRMREVGFIAEVGYEITLHKACIVIADVVEAKEDHSTFFL